MDGVIQGVRTGSGPILNRESADASELVTDAALVCVSTHVPRFVRNAFAAHARSRGKTAAAMLRDGIEATVREEPAAPASIGSARKLTLRLRDAVRARLRDEAAANGTTPTAWATAMLEAQLLRQPVWTGSEMAALRGIMAVIEQTRATMDGRADADTAAIMASAVSHLAEVMGRKAAYWGVRPAPGTASRAPARARGAARRAAVPASPAEA